jgi:hypothetical protein
MKPEFTPYHSSDFLKVRDFLVTNYQAFNPPVNWSLVRWNYARYFVAPMFGARGTGKTQHRDPDTSSAAAGKAVALWESVIGVWKTMNGNIAGVVCPDEYVPWHPAFGQAFLQRHPDHENLLPDMLDYAEKTLAHNKTVRLYVGEGDRALITAARDRGYVRDETPCLQHMEYDLSCLPDPDLPPGYRFLDMTESVDLEKRRKVGGLSFRHKDPRDWPSLLSYQSWHTAPDYRPQLDLVVVRPDREYVACTVGWYDAFNRMATLEPLGSIQLGMGREVAMEALRRTAAMGATVAFMDSGLKYYQKIGFRKRFSVHRWIQRL